MTEKMMSPGGSGDVMVSRKGSRSLFQAFCVSVPELVRDAHDKRPKNRQAVSQMEMNKALAASGLKSIRKRDRSTGGTRWCSKVGVFKNFINISRLIMLVPLSSSLLYEIFFLLQTVS